MTTSPEPTSMSGFALRVKAIRPPAMITPDTATATASGRIHCWSWPTTGSPARSGDGKVRATSQGGAAGKDGAAGSACAASQAGTDNVVVRAVEGHHG
jgi:hypothetical protein